MMTRTRQTKSKHKSRNTHSKLEIYTGDHSAIHGVSVFQQKKEITFFVKIYEGICRAHDWGCNRAESSRHTANLELDSTLKLEARARLDSINYIKFLNFKIYIKIFKLDSSSNSTRYITRLGSIRYYYTRVELKYFNIYFKF